MICAGRTLGPLQTLVDELASEAVALELDVDDPSSVSSLLDRLPEDWRTVDLLINNAGHDVGGRRHFVEGESEQVSFGGLEKVLEEPDTQLRLFGKPAVSGKRRMGVVIARAETIDEARAKARRGSEATEVRL